MQKEKKNIVAMILPLSDHMPIVSLYVSLEFEFPKQGTKPEVTVIFMWFFFKQTNNFK